MLIREIHLAYHTLLEEAALGLALRDTGTRQGGLELAVAEMVACGGEMREGSRDGGGHGSGDGDLREGLGETGEGAHG